MAHNEKIVNIETGEEIFRDYSSAEIVEIEKIQAENVRRNQELADKEIARLAILEKLGITEDEAKLLLG